LAVLPDDGHGAVVVDDICRALEGLRSTLRLGDTRLGLMGVTLHTLQHFTASRPLAVGTHTNVVQGLLAHSAYAITADF